MPSLERIIVARVPAAFDKKVEMPYGPAISPCVNSSMVATDGTECVSEGVEAGKSYTYTSFFDVLRSFPAVSIHNHQFCTIFKIYFLGSRRRNSYYSSSEAREASQNSLVQEAPRSYRVLRGHPQYRGS